MIVSPKIGARTLKAFIEDAKSKPETFTYASAGTGSQTHLAAEYFPSQAGISWFIYLITTRARSSPT